ncbi:MAG TPA: SDR family NAD(P)-dependent oxidoreductase [Solirubrobacteraceae bacterium]|jgi:3-oxoacyl-[acyl-carrier protein] reductase|nr:SDR family NAD(P)-dependent oxidoreductase [Solirubrobacteraceae bacterium]
MRLEGKAALVTGAAGGIGLAVVQRFAREGARVTAVDLDPERVRDAVKGIPNVQAIGADVTDSASVDAAFAVHDQSYGALEVVVTAAGVSGARGKGWEVGDETIDDSINDLENISDAEFASVVDVNLAGTFYCLRAAVRRMRPRGDGGSIITISSVGALINFPLPAPYAASKAGVLGLTRVAAARLAPDDIRVNAVAPGGTETSMLPPPGSPMREGAMALQPIKRAASPEEMANTILFLASDEAAFITGQTISPNGGAHM